MVIGGDIRTLPESLQRLQESHPPQQRVLSVYLDLSPSRILGQDYLIYFQDGCKDLRARLAPPELDRFESAVERAETYLAGEFTPRRPGLALFASGSPDWFYVVELPKPPIEGVIWDERPVLAPLYEVLDDYERVAVLLFDKERARLFTIYLGEIEQQRTVQHAVPGRQATGEWFGLAQTRFARHREEHVIRHAEAVIDLLIGELRSRPFDRLIIGGPDEAIALLKAHLPRPLRRRLAGIIDAELFASDAAVLEKALQAMERIEREQEQDEVEELFEAAATPHVALGPEATLEALHQGRVHRLLIAEGVRGAGGECHECGRLLVEANRCPSCGGHAGPVEDLREYVVRQALAQGAKVEFVSGEAARRLMAQGGLGAWTRYEP